jgi:hypothetical protein
MHEVQLVADEEQFKQAELQAVQICYCWKNFSGHSSKH